MYIHQAQRLRREWAAKGNPPCDHAQVQPETTVTRYSTGNWICVTCGKSMPEVKEAPRR